MELNQPVPELPVSDVEKAQQYYQQYFGCKVEWITPGHEIGAVSNGDTAIFFRQRSEPIQPIALWVYCRDLNNSYKTLEDLGANIVEKIAKKPWNLMQFSVQDLDGNTFYFYD